MSTEDKENNPEDKTSQVYEVGYLILPTIPEESVAGEVSKIKEIIQKQGGVFIADDFPKMRPLTYTMYKMADGKRQKYDVAYFGWIKFDLAPSAINKLKTALDGNDSLVRFLIIKTVRENTIYGPRLAAKKVSENNEGPASKAETKPELSPEELDKTIDDLVISE